MHLGSPKNSFDVIVRSDDEKGMRYPGGKFRCFQKLISLMPPHRAYIETHLGGGAVIRNKLPAEQNIGIDIDARVVEQFGEFPAGYQFVACDCVAWLRQQKFQGDELVYSDPPYPAETRRAPRYYRHEYTTEDHVELLSVLKKLPCRVMLSSYPNDRYEQELSGWHKVTFNGTSHTGRRTECVWMNFVPGEVHDTRYLGWDFRGRQSWKRKQQRWIDRFARLPRAEQQAMLDCLHETFSGKTANFSSPSPS